MSIKIGLNIASIQAQRRLGEATSSLGSIYEKLSSGQRINRASDDAAGLAIADDLNAKGRIFTQGIGNGNDGISLLNIADSAIDNLSSVVTRIRELSEQSANGTYSAKQRAALDAEAQALSKEFTRITQTTSFNSIKLFDGSLGAGIRLQLGVGVAEFINASVGGPHGTATIRLGTGDGNFGNALSFTAEDFNTFALSLGDLNGDGVLDLVTAGNGGISGKSTVILANTKDGLGSILNFSLKTKSDSLQAMSIFDKALENLAKQRGTIGASQSRVTIAISNLQTSRENLKAAESRIRDADIAAESANLQRTQILQQAATSVLAQANQAPALALTLLS